MTSLLDVLKETDQRVGFTEAFKSLGSRENLDRETLQHRLLLSLYGLGTNAGLKRMVSSNRDVTYGAQPFRGKRPVMTAEGVTV